MFFHSEMQNASAVVANDEEAVQDSKGEGGNSEEVHGSDSFAVVLQEAPQVGFSTTMRKISSRNSLLIRFLPEIFRWRDIQFQYNRNPARCHRTTVSGVTITRACFHWDHRRRVITQNNLSGQPILGLES